MRELALLLQANIPLVSALSILIDSETKKKNKIVLLHIKADVSGGLSFSQALSKYPRTYSPLICHLVQAGERAAALPLMLNTISDYQDKMNDLKSKMIKSLSYPVLVLVSALLITMGLMLYVIPQFEQLFGSFGAELPFLTKTVMWFANSLKQYGIIVFMILILSGFLGAKYFLKLPGIKKIYAKFMSANMMRTLAMLLKAGIAMSEALRFLSVPVLRDAVMQGELLSRALYLHKKNYLIAPITPMMIQLIRVGEESGVLSEMLSRVAGMMESQVDVTLSRFTQWLEPVMMIFMGVVVGGLVMAMYLPIFELGNIV